MKVLAHHLSEDQIRNLSYECGSHKFTFNCGKFQESCLRHDVAYSSGGTQADKIEADRAFYKHMKRKQVTLWDKVVTIFFYTTVRLIGHLFFNYGKYLTVEETIIFMHEKRH